MKKTTRGATIPTTMGCSTKILPTKSARNRLVNSRPHVNFRQILPRLRCVHQKKTVAEQEVPPNF